VPIWHLNRTSIEVWCLYCRSKRAGCSFGKVDFGVDRWPRLNKTREGDIRRAASSGIKISIPAGGKGEVSSSKRSKAPAKASGQEELVAVRPTQKLKLRASTSASALLQTAPAVSEIQESVGVVSTLKSGPEKSAVRPSIIPTIAPSDPSVRLYQPPQTNVSPAQVTGRGQWVFVEDIGRFETALGNDSLGVSELQRLSTELSMIRERELAELRACQSLVEGRSELVQFLIKRLDKKAKRAMEKLLEDDSEDEDGNTTIRGLGEDEGEEEDDEEEANAEAGGSGSRSGVMGGE